MDGRDAAAIDEVIDPAVDLDAGGEDDDTVFSAGTPTEEEVAEPPSEGSAFDELMLESERPASAADAFGVDPELADEGKWFNWPKLGPNARLKIARTQNHRWTELFQKARRKFGNRRTGEIPPEKAREILPGIYARAVLVGMEGVILQYEEGKPTARIVRKERVGKGSGARWVAKTFDFGDLADDGGLRDTFENRAMLLRLFQPDLENDVFVVADNTDNFRDDDPEPVRGN